MQNGMSFSSTVTTATTATTACLIFCQIKIFTWQAIWFNCRRHKLPHDLIQDEITFFPLAPFLVRERLHFYLAFYAIGAITFLPHVVFICFILMA